MEENFAAIAEKFSIDTNEDISGALSNHMALINVNLEPFGFKIDMARDQIRGEMMYIFVNTRFDDIIKNCTPYTPSELDAIKQLIDNIMASDFAFCIPHGNAKRLVGNVTKMNTSETSFFLMRLIDDGWFEITDQNRVILSTAALAELRLYLADRYGKFSSEDPQGKLLYCTTCGDLVTIGLKCPQEECNVAFHRRCHSVFARRGGANLQCPNYSRCKGLVDESNAVIVGPEV